LLEECLFLGGEINDGNIDGGVGESEESFSKVVVVVFSARQFKATRGTGTSGAAFKKPAK